MSPVTRTGDEMVRTALYQAANVLLSRITRFSKLKRWGMDVAKRRGSKRAKVALARKIGVILHRWGLTAQLTDGPKRSGSQRRLDQGGIRDASGAEQRPLLPRNDGSARPRCLRAPAGQPSRIAG